MLAAIESREIDKSVVNAFSLEQLRAFSDPDIDKKLESIWPVGSQQDLKAKEISRLRGLLSSGTSVGEIFRKADCCFTRHASNAIGCLGKVAVSVQI